MGAENIDFKLKNKATVLEIKQAFKERQRADRERNGHRDGYSADFQTVHSVDTSYLIDTFSELDSAYDFCLDKAVKWESVVAVYFKNKQGETNTLVAGWGAS